MLKTNSDRAKVSFRSLCAIAKRELAADPTIDTVEWKERIKDRVSRDGFRTPWSEQVYRAMAAIEYAHPNLRQRVQQRRQEEIPPDWLRRSELRAQRSSEEGFTPVRTILERLLLTRGSTT